ncbi:phosphodiester glycosidase family protein [Mucilaginibacter boryungensis]|uniref:Phosphodiester glycosidase family protein n=1 Tax=Mucilaginibacter boryungensis TaxID=768480 RepID=A0ABR9XN11_9SPHI|nr:phosphodiester glycosidase family protein [Mucilaginibacter boryungensis]MBE9668766.1 phosphodiester glycosidase family protein [Mucilaginibacter boryungensis]
MKNFIYVCFALAIGMCSCKKPLNSVTPVDATGSAFGSPKLKENGIVASNDSAFYVSTYAGTAGTYGTTNGSTPSTSTFHTPEGLAFDSNGNMFVADCGNNLIRKITPAGVVSTFAGSTTAGLVDGTGTAARFDSPIRIAIDGSNNIYVADRDNNRIRKITSAGVVTTIAGGGTAPNSFNFPIDVAVTSDGSTLYVADAHNNVIKKIAHSGSSYTTSVYAGSGTAGFLAGTGTAAEFNNPSGVAIDAAGSVIVADRNNNCIRKITTAKAVYRLAGVAGTSYDVDADNGVATFGQPYGVTVANDGCIYVTDIGYHQIRRISNSGSYVNTVAGTGGYNGTTDGRFNTKFDTPTSIAIDNSGNFYVADAFNHTIRKLTPETRVIQFTEGWTPMDTSTYAGVKWYRYRGNRFYLPSAATNKSQNINVIDIDLSVNHLDFKHIDVQANHTTVSNIIGSPTNVIAAMSGTFATGSNGKFCAYLRNSGTSYWLADSWTQGANAGDHTRYWHYHDAMFYVDASGNPGMEQSDMNQDPFSPTLRPYMMSGAPLLIRNSVPIENNTLLKTDWGVTSPTTPQNLRDIIAARSIVALPIINNHILLICIDGIEIPYGGTATDDCYALGSVTAPARYGMTTADATEFVQRFFHPTWAINMDGGGSSSMYMMGVTSAKEGNNGGVSGGISVIDYPDWDGSCSAIPGTPHDQYYQQRITMQDAICVIAGH